jgi:4-amino-4-deoxy-L-arabinose transferase-like glycosyltransferase
LATAARLAYWLLATPDRPLFSDASQYNFLAKNIAGGFGYVDVFPQLALHPTAFRPPVYPGLLGFVYWVLWPSPGLGRLVNVVIGVAVVVVTYLVVRRRLGARAGLVAGGALALVPNIIANDTYVLTEPLSLLLIVVLLDAMADERWLRAAVVTGVLVLTRPSAQFLVLVFAVWLVRRISWKRTAAYMAVAGLVVAPWVVRNWIQLDSPVLVTSNGFNYAAVYSPPAAEAGHFIDPYRHPYFDDKRLAQFDEVAWDRSLRQLAVENVKDNPGLVPKVVARNTAAYFEIRPRINGFAEEADGRHTGVRNATLWALYLLLVAGAIGLWTLRREPLVALAGLVGTYFTAASLVFVQAPRLRAPLELALCIGLGALAAGRRVDGGAGEPADDRRSADAKDPV